MKIILYVFTLLFLAVSACVYTIQEYEELYLLIGSINGDMIMRVALICAAVCLVILSAVVIIKKEKRRVLHTVVCLMISAAMIYCVSISWFFSRPYTYYDFTSPDGKYTVIAGEWSWLQGGGVNFYERINPVFVKKIGSFSTDDGYQPINKGDYTVEWNGNIMEFIADNGNGIDKSLKIEAEK